MTHPYIPHTEADVRAMLERIGVRSVEELFEPIPEEYRFRGALAVGEALPELRLEEEAEARAARNITPADRPHFLGGGCYDHYVPAAVDSLASRGEFLTAYTPYQAEASQGTLQLIFEFQTMVAELLGLDIANASLYDGASALAEGVLLAASLEDRNRVLLPESVHPEYRQVLATYLRHLDLEILELSAPNGRLDLDRARAALDERSAVLALQQPNFFGVLEDAGPLAAAAHAAGARVVGVSTDPSLLAVLAPPGEWGADVAVGEGQSLGNYPSYGGPHLGLIAARAEFVKRMPGRIAGETVDDKGRRGYVLTFQTREQHIRRAKATSNICTNQALIATRSSIYLSLLGREGLAEVARLSLAAARYAGDRIAALKGWGLRFRHAHAHELTVACPRPASEVNQAIFDAGMLGGIELARWYPEREKELLLAFTERTRKADIDSLIECLKKL